MSGKKIPLAYVLDREACIRAAQTPQLLNAIIAKSPTLYTPSCVKKALRKLDSGSYWGALSANTGIVCYSEDAAFFEMCGSLRDAANALSAARVNFEEEKLHIIAVARLLGCPIISGDRSTSSSSMSAISQRFAVALVGI